MSMISETENKRNEMDFLEMDFFSIDEPEVTEEEPVIETVVEEVKAEEPVAVVEPAPVITEEPAPAMEEAPAEAEPEVKAEEVEEVVAEEVPVEEEQEEVAAAETTGEEVVEEEKPKKATRKRKTTKKEEDKEIIRLTTKKIDLLDTLGKFAFYFEDDEFNAREQEYVERVAKIIPQADINPSTVRIYSAELSAIYSEVLPLYLEAKKLHTALTDKEFGYATIYRMINAGGSNTEERKRNGAESLLEAKVGRDTINLMDAITGLKMRFESLKTIMEAIDFKQKGLIPFLSTLKMEQSFDYSQV